MRTNGGEQHQAEADAGQVRDSCTAAVGLPAFAMCALM